jgi:hypothetical protein
LPSTSRSTSEHTRTRIIAHTVRPVRLHTPHCVRGSNEHAGELAIGDYTWSQGVSHVRVSHTDHGFFVVVAGPEAPAACKFVGGRRP